MAVLQQLQQPAWRDVAVQLPRPERCDPSVARDLGEGVSAAPVSFDRKHLDGLTTIRIIGWTQTRGFADPTVAGE
jgi:hypothetical protein